MNEKKDENLDIEIIDDFILEQTAQIDIPNGPIPMMNNQDSGPTTSQPRQQPFSNPTPMPNNPEREVVPRVIPNPNIPNEPQLMPIREPNPNMEKPGKTLEKSSKKKKSKKFLIILLLIIILTGVGLYIYYIKASNPKQLMVKGINKLTSNIENLYEPFSKSNIKIEESKTTTGNVSFNLKLNLGDSLPVDQEMEKLINMVVDKLNNVNIGYKYQKDVDNKKMLLNLVGDLNNDELFNFNLFSENNKQYIFLKNIFDKYIEIGTLDDLEKRDMAETVEDISYFWKTILESLMKNINNSHFITEKTTINLNGNEQNVKKTTLILNEENQKELYKLVINDIKKDERAMEIDSKYDIGIKEIDVNENMDSSMFEQEFNYTVYYKDITNEIVMLDFENLTSNQKVIYKIGKEDTIEIIDNDNSIYKLTLNIEPERFTINATISENSIITIKGEQNKDNYTYSWNLISDEFTVTGHYILKTEIINETIEYNTSRDFNIKISQKGEELITLNIMDNAKTVKDAIINENVTNKIHINDITAEDFNEIMMGLQSLAMKFLTN
ncbi:MAG: hypothetical protein PHW32_03565 [Bacilli bacterium]|nr:hypothetical protein [Bacilli bacterium]MDD4282767.1 hypothetical protein [Bacilli bacterium]MDD4718375.1 hypothetical protein [Bacilli bacterium]